MHREENLSNVSEAVALMTRANLLRDQEEVSLLLKFVEEDHYVVRAAWYVDKLFPYRKGRKINSFNSFFSN